MIGIKICSINKQFKVHVHNADLEFAITLSLLSMMCIVERKKKERRKEMNVRIICKKKSVNYKRMIIVNVLSHLTSNWAMAVFV